MPLPLQLQNSSPDFRKCAGQRLNSRCREYRLPSSRCTTQVVWIPPSPRLSPQEVNENPEQGARETANQEDVTLHRIPDGSHEAVDEPKLPKSETTD